MPATGSGSGVTRVDVVAIRNAAAEGRQNVSNFREIIDKMEQAMNSSESFWEGDAAELYRNVFRKEVSSLRQAFEVFAAYPNELTEYADRYQETDTRATNIANSIEVAVWADV